LSIISYAGPIGAILGGAAGGALLGMGTEMLIQKIEGREELDGGAILREGAIDTFVQIDTQCLSTE